MYYFEVSLMALFCSILNRGYQLASTVQHPLVFFLRFFLLNGNGVQNFDRVCISVVYITLLQLLFHFLAFINFLFDIE